jgi:iron complex transport system ATP-binding protein
MAKELKNTICQVTDLRMGFSPRNQFNKEGWSFSINAGDLIALIGPNGSGKTTLLRSLMGESTLLSGRVHVAQESHSVQEWVAREIATHFSYLPQEQPFEPSQRVEGFVSLAYLACNGVLGKITEEQSELLEKQLRLFDLEKQREKTLGSLSTGERQRVFLARVMLQPSKIVLLDEPTNHLDPEALARFWNALSLFKGDKTVVVSTHDIPFAKKMSDGVLALRAGRLLFCGPTLEFFQKGLINELFPSLAN